MATKKKTNKKLPYTIYPDGSVDGVEFLEHKLGKLTFGRHLRAIRLGEELTLREFAEQLGVSIAHLSDIEQDRRVVSAPRAAAWAKVLGYGEAQFVSLALQQYLDGEGLDLVVHVEAAPKRRRSG